MSGVEVLGIVAAAAQMGSYLVQTISAIDTLRTRIKDAPQKFQEHHSELLHLRTALVEVESNPCCDSDEVKKLLQSITDKANTIAEDLDQQRKENVCRVLLRAINKTGDKKLVSELEGLSRNQSTLTTLIFTTFSKQQGVANQKISESVLDIQTRISQDIGMPVPKEKNDSKAKAGATVSPGILLTAESQ